MKKLDSILGKHTVAELKDMIKALDITGLGKAKKQEIIDAIHTKITDREYLKEIFLYATEEEIKRFTMAAAEKTVIEPGSYEFYYLRSYPIVFEAADGTIIIPDEIKECYEEIRADKDYQEKKEKYNIIDRYALACINFYGVIELSKFVSIVNDQVHLGLTKEWMEQWLAARRAVRENNGYFYDGGYLIAGFYNTEEGHPMNYHTLLEKQMDKKYYVPSAAALMKYTDLYYTEDNMPIRAIIRYMIDRLGADEKRAEEFGKHIQLIIRHGAMPKDVFNECINYGIEFGNPNTMNDFLTHLIEVYNNARLPENRGFTANELDMNINKKKKPQAASEVLMPEVPIVKNRYAGKKIYPNDMCPCGSGKKFKNCCGRKIDK